MEPTYKIVRFFFQGEKEIVAEGLTLEEAQEHCNDPETSSKTCTNNPYPGKLWFDGYSEE